MPSATPIIGNAFGYPHNWQCLRLPLPAHYCDDHSYRAAQAHQVVDTHGAPSYALRTLTTFRFPSRSNTAKQIRRFFPGDDPFPAMALRR